MGLLVPGGPTGGPPAGPWLGGAFVPAGGKLVDDEEDVFGRDPLAGAPPAGMPVADEEPENPGGAPAAGPE